MPSDGRLAVYGLCALVAAPIYVATYVCVAFYVVQARLHARVPPPRHGDA